jgi:excisionase family DNA binding protein
MKRAVPDIAPAVMTVNDLARYLKVHPSTVYRLLRTGQLPAFKVGRDWRFNIEKNRPVAGRARGEAQNKMKRSPACITAIGG